VDFPGRRRRFAERLEALEVGAALVTRLVNVRYLTGFTGSNGQLLFAAGGDGSRGTFFTDFRYEEQSRHQVPDLERVIAREKFPEAFVAAAKALAVAKVGFEEEDVTYRIWRDLTEAAEGTELVPLGPEVERLRWVKEPEERALIARAQAVTDAGFEDILGRLAEGVTEREIALELELAMRRAGADALAFDSIVAFGENAAEPHHHPADRALKRGDVVKLDFGGLVEGYHADMTRTVALGDPGDRMREVYKIVHEAQAAGIAAVRPGVEGKVADGASRQVITDAGYGEFFGHSLGHGVGLEIHEGPTLRATSDDLLPVSAVVTVEPGIYLPGEGGVRIEDMVEVIEGGCIAMPAATHDLLVL